MKLAAGAADKDLSETDRAELAAANATMFPLRPRRGGTVFDRAVTAEHMLRDRVPVERISAPVLVINAAHALLAPHDDAVSFVARLQQGELVELPTGGHVLIGNVSRLRETVAAFLAGTNPDPASVGSLVSLIASSVAMGLGGPATLSGWPSGYDGGRVVKAPCVSFGTAMPAWKEAHR